MRTKRLATEPCRAEGCIRPLRRLKGKKGQIWYDFLCQLHRDRWTKYRNLDRGRGIRKADNQLQTRYRKTTINSKTYQAHRAIWSKIHGPIPVDYVVHHKDGNRLNNSLDNLVAMPPNEHKYLHGRGADRV